MKWTIPSPSIHLFTFFVLKILSFCKTNSGKAVDMHLFYALIGLNTELSITPKMLSSLGNAWMIWITPSAPSDQYLPDSAWAPHWLPSEALRSPTDWVVGTVLFQLGSAHLDLSFRLKPTLEDWMAVRQSDLVKHPISWSAKNGWSFPILPRTIVKC